MRLVSISLVVIALVALPVRAEQASSYSTPAPAASTFFPGGSSATSASSYTMPKPGSILPSSLFDPSRFSIRNSFTYGYTSGGGFKGSAGLFTSSLGYVLKPNMRFAVDVGAHINPAFSGEEVQKGIFLQGAAFDWNPTRNSLVRIEYRDLRSPLQYGGYGGYWGHPSYGYMPGYGYGGYGYGEPGLGMWAPERVSTPPLADPSRN
ncbi:MAG: hypothetical protein ACREOU_15835 [Candidatus Eiseniibacteriota bacterium]